MRTIVTAATAASALVVGVLTTAAAAQSDPARAAIAGTHPRWATASERMAKGPVTTGTVTAKVYLAGHDSAGLAAYAAAVSAPRNVLYGRYLTPAQVMARFGPTAAQVSAITTWLTGVGLTVIKVDDNVAGFIEVEGSIQAAAKALGVTFGTFRGPDKKADRAPEQTATASASVASAVLTVTGLDTATHAMKPADTLPPPGPNYWIAPRAPGTTARRRRPMSRPPTAGRSRGRTAATLPGRSAAPTTSPAPA